MTTVTLTVKFKYFQGAFTTWDALFGEAAEFAAHIGRERLIGISHSPHVVAVWYWGEPGRDDA